MFYPQNINNIKLVILSLDGGLLNLNKLRYNYFSKICLSYQKEISVDDFSRSIGNMKTMYDCSPIKDEMSSQEINQVIERDLFSYCKLKPDIRKEGVEELLQFFKQKKIKIAVVSTHKSKRAIQYLQLARIYKYIDFLIGGDCELEPIPDASIFIETARQVNVNIEETLVIGDCYQFILAANRAMSNVIYITDLIPPTPQIKNSVFKCVRNNLEIINLFLFSKYETAELFSPLLGMSSDMDFETLQEVYHKLMKQYQDDTQLQSIVENVYHHYLYKLEPDKESENDALINAFEDQDTPLSSPIDLQEEPSFNDDESLDQDTSLPINELPHQETIKEPIIQEDLVDTKDEVVDTKEEPTIQDKEITQEIPVSRPKDEPIPQIEVPEYIPDAYSTTSAITIDTDRMTELINVINGDVARGQEEKETQDDKEKLPHPQDDTDDTPMTKVDHLVAFIYYLMINVIVAVVVMIAFIPLQGFIEGDGLINVILKNIADFYIQIVNGFYGLIFNGLHAFLSFVPSYDSLTANNAILSHTAILLILCILFNLLICYIVKGIYHLISRQIEE